MHYLLLKKKQKNMKMKCRYNPETKKCGTCRYLVSVYGNMVCDCRPEDGADTFEYYDESLTCPYHELEERK